MDILEIIKNRRSVRVYQPKEIQEKVIDRLAESLIWAPSAGNLQSRKFYFVFDQKIKDELNLATFSKCGFLCQAPLVIVGCTDDGIMADYEERGKNLYSICDVSVSIQNLMLQAYAEGLATCWVGAFDEEKVSQILKLPGNLRPIVMTPVGYSAKQPKTPERVSKDKAVELVK